MKTMEELKARFASIQDLPVSEEMIGAYIEGNLDSIQAQCVEDMMHQDCEFASLVDDCKAFDDMHNQSYLMENVVDFTGLEDFNLPELPIDIYEPIDVCEPFVVDSCNPFEHIAYAGVANDFDETHDFLSDDVDRFIIDDASLDIESSLDYDSTDDIINQLEF